MAGVIAFVGKSCGVLRKKYARLSRMQKHVMHELFVGCNLWRIKLLRNVISLRAFIFMRATMEKNEFDQALFMRAW